MFVLQNIHTSWSVLMFCKDSANRTKNQIYLDFSEVQPIFSFWKKIVFFIDIAKFSSSECREMLAFRFFLPIHNRLFSVSANLLMVKSTSHMLSSMTIRLPKQKVN